MEAFFYLENNIIKEDMLCYDLIMLYKDGKYEDCFKFAKKLLSFYNDDEYCDCCYDSHNDKEITISEFEKSILQGLLAHLYRFGKGMKRKNLRQAYKLYQVTCFVPAVYDYANMLFYGDVLTKNKDSAIEKYHLLSKKNDTLSLLTLAHLYKNGIHVSKNSFKEKAYLSQIDAPSSVILFEANSHFYTDGKQEDDLRCKDFLEYILPFTNGACPEVYSTLGIIYLLGLSTKQDYKLAINYLEKAANLFQIDALKILATVYKNGIYRNNNAIIKKNIARSQDFSKQLEYIDKQGIVKMMLKTKNCPPCLIERELNKIKIIGLELYSTMDHNHKKSYSSWNLIWSNAKEKRKRIYKAVDDIVGNKNQIYKKKNKLKRQRKKNIRK